jgi:hypothetical protein
MAFWREAGAMPPAGLPRPAAATSLTESEKASDSKGRGRGPVRISYRLRFRHRQRGLIWISGHQTAVNRDFRLLSRDL